MFDLEYRDRLVAEAVDRIHISAQMATFPIHSAVMAAIEQSLKWMFSDGYNARLVQEDAAPLVVSDNANEIDTQELPAVSAAPADPPWFAPYVDGLTAERACGNCRMPMIHGRLETKQGDGYETASVVHQCEWCDYACEIVQFRDEQYPYEVDLDNDDAQHDAAELLAGLEPTTIAPDEDDEQRARVTFAGSPLHGQEGR